MTQGHLYLKHSVPNINDGHSRHKRPTKDQVTSKQPQCDLKDHLIFCSGMDVGMTQGHFDINTVCQISKMAALDTKDQLKIK